MRKVMLLAAMLAMVLAAAVPALGQGDVGDVNEGDDQFNVGDETVYSAVCQNIIGAFQASAGQGATAVGAASADDNAAAVSEIAQAQDVSVAQANECLNAWFASASPSTSPTPHATADGGGGGGSASAAGGTLPATGGASLIALGAGFLVLSGGLLARWIIRR